MQIHVGIIMRYDVAHAAHFSNGEFRDGRRVASVRCAAASPMISMRRITASCFSLLALNSASVVSLTYEPMSRAASRMSRSGRLGQFPYKHTAVARMCSRAKRFGDFSRE